MIRQLHAGQALRLRPGQVALPELDPVDMTIPEPLLRAAAAAERRTMAVLDRVMIKLAETEPNGEDT